MDNNKEQDKWIKVWLSILIIFFVVFATVFIVDNGRDSKIDNRAIISIYNEEEDQLPAPEPDLSAYETYNPIPGYIGSALGGVTGFGFLGWYIKKRDTKLDSIDNKVTKIDTEVSVIQSKVDRNISDIEAVRSDLQDGERIRRIYKDLGGLK